jgi:hypothetical protein
MRRTSLLLLAALFVVFIGCGGSEPEPASEAERETGSAAATASADLVTRAAEISKAIEADPDAAEEILQRYEITVEEFEQLMFEIAADPELSKAFEAAR